MPIFNLNSEGILPVSYGFFLQTRSSIDMKNRYVLLSAVRNEEKYVEFTLKSIVNQTVKPLRWIIVSDNSNDRTDEIVQQYATENSFIRLIKGTGDPKRNFGSQIRAINFGYSMLDIDTYDFIGNVDGDVSFKSD